MTESASSPSLTQSQQGFLDLLITRQALSFGSFTLKSGRTSPYFVNTGCFHLGSDIEAIGRAYADTVVRHFGRDIQVIFGPAYKGIPIALATAQAYQKVIGHPVGWAFDRKEAKDHGDGGSFVGNPLTPGVSVVMVDDVITAGTAVREAMAKLAVTGVDVRGVVVAVDRQERGLGAVTAVEELAKAFGVPVVSTITITEATDHLVSIGKLSPDDRERIRRHIAGKCP